MTEQQPPPELSWWEKAWNAVTGFFRPPPPFEPHMDGLGQPPGHSHHHHGLGHLRTPWRHRHHGPDMPPPHHGHGLLNAMSHAGHHVPEPDRGPSPRGQMGRPGGSRMG